ncbi:hypothetical protein ACWEPI_26370 [Streptomyces sp. NPDC004262]
MPGIAIPDDVPSGPLRDYLKWLHQLHRDAGWPSSRDLATQLGDTSHTTITRLFKQYPSNVRLAHRLITHLAQNSMRPRERSEQDWDEFYEHVERMLVQAHREGRPSKSEPLDPDCISSPGEVNLDPVKDWARNRPQAPEAAPEGSLRRLENHRYELWDLRPEGYGAEPPDRDLFAAMTTILQPAQGTSVTRGRTFQLERGFIWNGVVEEQHPDLYDSSCVDLLAVIRGFDYAFVDSGVLGLSFPKSGEINVVPLTSVLPHCDGVAVLLLCGRNYRPVVTPDSGPEGIAFSGSVRYGRVVCAELRSEESLPAVFQSLRNFSSLMGFLFPVSSVAATLSVETSDVHTVTLFEKSHVRIYQNGPK